MLSTCIDFLFFGLYLTDNMKSLRHVMSGEASGIRSALPALLKCSAKKKENKDSWMKDCGKNLPVTNSFMPVVCLCTAAHFLPLCPGRCPVLIFLVCRNGPRIRERMRRWFLSLYCSSCVIRPRSDPTCPDVPPHPSSCTSVTHTLMYRWWRAVCKLAWPAVWFSEDIAEPPVPRGRAASTLHYSFTFTFIRILFRLLLI